MEEAGDLRKRFGRLVAAHRRRAGLTQEALAAAAELSADMIGRIEAGQTGARFPSIERLAAALRVDPAELFTTELTTGTTRSKPLLALSARLAALLERDIAWIDQLLDAALKPRS
jgi:transcriptional regulator with XRE-family HTH domain